MCYGVAPAEYCTKVYTSFPKDDCESTNEKSTDASDDDSGGDPWSGPYNNFNQTYKTAGMSKGYYLPSGMAVCVKECPTKNNFDQFICEYDYQAEIDALAASDSEVDQALAISLGYKYVNDKKCMPMVETYDYMGYCMPSAAQDALQAGVNAAMEAEGLNTTKLAKAADKDWWEMFQADFFTVRVVRAVRAVVSRRPLPLFPCAGAPLSTCGDLAPPSPHVRTHPQPPE